MVDAARTCPPPVMQAASELMVEIGYTAMTMRKLAQRVGILPGSLYHHVDCKQDLLLNVVLDIVEKRLQAWHESVCPRDLKGYVCFSLDRQVTVPQEDLILRHEVRHLEASHRRWLDRASARLAQPVECIIQKGCATGQYRVDAPPKHRWRSLRLSKAPTACGSARRLSMKPGSRSTSCRRAMHCCDLTNTRSGARATAIILDLSCLQAPPDGTDQDLDHAIQIHAVVELRAVHPGDP